MNSVEIRKEEILTNLKNVISEVYEMDIHDVNVAITFLEMGLDSISIIQVKQLVKNEYGFDIPVNRLFDDVSTLQKLADYILSMQPEISSKSEGKQATSIERVIKRELNSEIIQQGDSASIDGNAAVNLESIINSQLQIMKKQIELMSAMS